MDAYQTFDKNDTLRYAALHSLNFQRDSVQRLIAELENSTVEDMVSNMSDDLQPHFPNLDTTLLTLYEQLTLTDSLITVEQNVINAALALRLSLADSLNSSILAAHDFEEYEIAINDILIQTALDSVSFDSSQRATIETIAAMCPLAGGVAVYKARSLLYLYNDTIYFDDEALCAVSSSRLAAPEQQTQKSDGIKVYPNPSRGQFSIEFENPGIYQIHIYNVMGQRVFTARSNERIMNVDLNLSPGLHLIEAINEETQKVHKTKIVYEN